jgi:hypothetical protein
MTAYFPWPCPESYISPGSVCLSGWTPRFPLPCIRRERALRPSRGLITLREQKRRGSESQIGTALRARPSAAHRVQISRFRAVRTRKAIGICPSPFGEAVPVTPHWVRNPVWWSRKDRGGCRVMGEDRPLRHCVLQHHVNLRCDSAGCPPPTHLTRSAMTPSATPAGCLRGSSIAVLPCRSGKRCSYRARPGSGLPAGRHRHGPLSPGRSGHANLAGRDHGKPAAGIGLGRLLCRQTARGSGRVVPSGLPVSPAGPSA